MQNMGSRRLLHATMNVIWLLSFGILPKIALTQASPDPMDTCASMSDSAARLSCFDHEMQKRHAAIQQSSAGRAAASAPAAPNPAAAVSTARTRPEDDTIGLDGRQLILKRKAENIHSDAPEPIVVTLARLIQHPGHQYYFELDNG